MVLSLWLTPPPSAPINDQLAKLIESLPTAHPSLAPSPVFIPHITLTSQVPNDKTDLSCLNNAPALTVSIKSLSFGNAYFKKVYFSMDRSHGLLQLAQEARIKFNDVGGKDAEHAVENDYDPHLSLLYNDVELDDGLKTDVRDMAVKKAEEFGFRSWEGKSWEGGRVVLVRTEGAVEQWEIVATAELGNKKGYAEVDEKD